MWVSKTQYLSSILSAGAIKKVYIHMQSNWKTKNCINVFDGDYRFLSNFYPAEFTYKGVVFPTAEHAYQWAKCSLEEDRDKILQCKTPGQAKKVGKTVKLIDNWDQNKVYIMYNIVLQKFVQNPELVISLVSTKDRVLIEGNTWGDKFWGVDLDTYEGYNTLGVILMFVRSLSTSVKKT